MKAGWEVVLRSKSISEVLSGSKVERLRLMPATVA